MPIIHPVDEIVKHGRSSLPAETRQPLQDSNSQTSPCGTSSQKRSHTTSQSIVITPSEKRQTMLALSPERSPPAGQQWTTLEVQRVLSLTPGTKPAFKRLSNQPGSLNSMPDGPTHGSNTSCSPASTVAADLSPASCHIGNMSRQHTAIPHSSPGRQPADPHHMTHQTGSASEPQLADFPATQLAGVASALDLLMCQATQVVGVDATAADNCQTKLALNPNDSLAETTLEHPSELVLKLKHAEALGSTPMLQLGMGRDAEAVTHGRAPAGPSASPAKALLENPKDTVSEQGAASHTESTDASNAERKHSAERGHHAAPTDAALAAATAGDQKLGTSVNLPPRSAQDEQQHQRVPMPEAVLGHNQPEPAAPLQAGTGPSLDPDSLATDADTQEASQVSLIHASCHSSGTVSWTVDACPPTSNSLSKLSAFVGRQEICTYIAVQKCIKPCF